MLINRCTIFNFLIVGDNQNQNIDRKDIGKLMMTFELITLILFQVQANDIIHFSELDDGRIPGPLYKSFENEFETCKKRQGL